jgi:hypothetical protein
MVRITLYCLPRYSIDHAAALSSLSVPRMTILSASSGILLQGVLRS